MRLTDLSIKTLKAPETGAAIYYDDTLTGFGVRVSVGGTKSFVLTYGVRRQRETIGRVGVISLKDAREAAKKVLAEYTLGKPVPTTISWKEASDQYLLMIKQKRKPSTYQGYKYQLDKHFRFGETKLADLEPRDFGKRLERLSDRPAEHRHCYDVLHSFVMWAYHQHFFETNPLERMKAPPMPPSRERVLSRDELAAVFRAVMGGEGIFEHIVSMLILTGQRRSAIGALHDDWLAEEGFINVPAAYTKHKSHRFPIGPMAERVLEHTPRVKGNKQVFPALAPGHGATPAIAFNAWSKGKAALDKNLAKTGGVVAPWTLHDLRRTFRTNWAEMGISREVAEKYIHHISGVHSGVNGIYDRHTYLPEMKDAVAKWEERLQALLA